MQRQRVKQTTSLQERIAKQTIALKAQVEALPPGSIERERLARRARKAEVYINMEAWLASPGLKPPE